MALLLAAVLALTGCQSVLDYAVNNVMTQYGGSGTLAGSDTRFSDMVYTRPDMTALGELLDEACETGEKSMEPSLILEEVYAYYAAYDQFETMYNLADIYRCMDLTDAYYQDEWEYCASQESYVSETLETLYTKLAKSPVVAQLEERYFGEGFFDDYQSLNEGEDYEPVWNSGFSALYDQQNALLSQYYTALKDANDSGYSDELRQTVSGIMIELVSLRQEMARYLGYDSYEEMANLWYYSREMDSDTLDRYIDEIKTYLVPIYQTYLSDPIWRWLYQTKAQESDCLAYVQSTAENMGGTVQTACDTMVKQELYSISAGENRYSGAFEVYLPTFNVPFLFATTAGTMDDLLTVTHEFGHFTNDYAAGETYASSDVCEVFSQGMEYLSLCYADSLTEQSMKRLRKSSMLLSLSTYVEQMAYYSFERELYRMDSAELSQDTISQLYTQALQEFGIPWENIDPEEWTEITHFFRMPFYVYSYVVSNDAAMQIYELELAEPGSGLALYTEFAGQWENLPLEDYLKEYDLTLPTTKGRVEQVAMTFQAQISGDPQE